MDLGTIKKKQAESLEVKNIINEIKNCINGFHSRLNNDEWRINEL